MRGYYQISALTYPTKRSQASRAPAPHHTPKIKLKRLSTTLTIAVLMQGAIRCMTVAQLCRQDMQSLPPLYVRATTAFF
jgi:hypothetical protein